MSKTRYLSYVFDCLTPEKIYFSKKMKISYICYGFRLTSTIGLCYTMSNRVSYTLIERIKEKTYEKNVMQYSKELVQMRISC